MKALKELFDNQSKRSAELVTELRAHEETWPAIKHEYDQRDKACIAIASRLAAANLAASPTTFALEIELRNARWDRDRGKGVFNRRRSDLHREISTLTGPTINRFVTFCLERAKTLLAEFKFFSDDKKYNFLTDSRTVIVRHNGAALEKAKESIFAAMKTVREMPYHPLSEIKSRIAEFKKQFDEFDLLILETEEVTEQAASDMKPKTEPDKFTIAYPVGDGSLVLQGGRISSAGQGRRP